jgi:DNA-binding PucR family transcriptional regulator
VARRRLAVLSRMSGTQRLRLTETLGAWLETQGNAVETARRLQVHPQTVRYRLRQINEAFGDQLTDADSRFALEAVLRAGQLRRRSPSLQ